MTQKIKENIKTINSVGVKNYFHDELFIEDNYIDELIDKIEGLNIINDPVSYTHLRAHETGAYLVCRLLLEKKKTW